MNNIEKAIEDLKQHAGRTLKTPLSEDTVELAVEALGRQAERENIRCENCRYEHRNPPRKIAPCFMCSIAYASHFEPKENGNG